MLQEALNPSDGGPEVQRFGWTYRIGDRVIQTENDYDKDVFFLSEHGISSGRAAKIYRIYRHESIAKIKQNPYQLADDIRGIGFKTADELAAKVGIERDSPYRARAAVRYALRPPMIWHRLL